MRDKAVWGMICPRRQRQPTWRPNRHVHETLLHVGLRDKGVGAVCIRIRCIDILSEHAANEDWKSAATKCWYLSASKRTRREGVPIFDNTQDIPSLAKQVDEYLAPTVVPVRLLDRRHTLYLWSDLASRAHIRFSNFAECIGCSLQLGS
jgi:hypothetical protein